jgi:hypothetical protein
MQYRGWSEHEREMRAQTKRHEADRGEAWWEGLGGGLRRVRKKEARWGSVCWGERLEMALRKRLMT